MQKSLITSESRFSSQTIACTSSQDPDWEAILHPRIHSSLACYQFKSVAQIEESSDNNEYLLIAPKGITHPQNISEQFTILRNANAGFCCLVVFSNSRMILPCVEHAVDLFEQLSAKPEGTQAIVALVIKTSLVRDVVNALPNHTFFLRDLLMLTLMDSQSVWSMQIPLSDQCAVERTGNEENSSPENKYEEFIQFYGLLTLLSHDISKRGLYRNIYLRCMLKKLMKNEIKHERSLSSTLRNAIHYYGEKVTVKTPEEKLMFKLPGFYFHLNKLFNCFNLK